MVERNIRKIFLSGVIQGSSRDKSIHSQEYRKELRALLGRAFPQADICDPFDGHEKSVDYDDDAGKRTFFGHLDHVRSSDLVIAYLPHASLGTAIEVWESHKNGIPVWTISPMRTNWVIRFCSERIFDNIESLSDYLKNNHHEA
jgi:hypothetical protein